MISDKYFWAGAFASLVIGAFVSFTVGDSPSVGATLAVMFYFVGDRLIARYETGSWLATVDGQIVKEQEDK